LLLAIYDGLIVTLALRSQPGEVEAHPYEAGLTYERVLEAKRAASRDSVVWNIQTKREKALIQVTGLKSDREYEASLELLRPDDPSIDIRRTERIRGATSTQEVSQLKSGLWVGTLDITSSDAHYRLGPEKLVIEPIS